MKWIPELFGFATDANPHLPIVLDAVQRDIDAELIPATIEAIFVTVFDDGRFTMAYRYRQQTIGRHRNTWVN